MEYDTSEGYRITNTPMPILLALKPIAQLKAHEQTVPEDLNQLVVALRRDPVLRHPLITDQETGLVLDGTHRLAALTELGCRLAPCALVNYNNPKITVERWFRIVIGKSLREFTTKIVVTIREARSTREAEECLATRSCYASLEDERLCLVLPSHKTNPASIARRAFQIENTARDAGLRVSYTDNKSFPLKNGPGFFMSTIRIEKPEVVGSALERTLFPPKTTRHLIPSRPLGINVPVEWLNEENVMRANSRFIDHLRTKKVKHMPQGSWIGSRRYQEEVFMFE